MAQCGAKSRQAARHSTVAASLGIARALQLLPYVALAVAIWPLTGGFPRGHDWFFELVRVAEYRAALVAGQFPPYWAENLYAGYGSPVFIFYAPLFSFASALLSWFVSVPWAATGVLIFLTLVSVWCVHGMMRAALTMGGASDVSAARVAVYVYLLHPYLLGDKLIRNANAEFAGLCLAPLALAGLFMAGKRPRHAFVCLSLGLALVIVAHNLTALVLMGLVTIGALILYGTSGSRRTWLVLAAGVTSALLLAAFFWVPAMAMLPLMRPEELLVGRFDFHGQFPAFLSLFGHERFFSAGPLTPMVLAVVVGALLIRRRQLAHFPLLAALLVGALGFLFLMRPASTFVWENVPLLPFFQFPWRMMGPLALLTAIAAGLVFSALTAERSSRLRAIDEGLLFLLCLVNAVPSLMAYQHLGTGTTERVLEALEPEAIRNSTHSATVRDEYLPRGANPITWKRQRPVQGPVVSFAPPVRLTVHEDRGSRIELEVIADEPARLRLARWAFPGWRLEINGRPDQVQANPLGSIDVEVPPGQSRVRLKLAPPPVRRACTLVSLGALLLWVGLVLGRPRSWWGAAAGRSS